MVFLLVLFLTLAIVYAVSYRSTTAPNDSQTEPTETESMTDFENTDQPFSIELPEQWEHTQLQGIDSRIGEFTDGEITITYDYGWYSGFPVTEDNPRYSGYTVEEFDVLEDRVAIQILYPESSAGSIAVLVSPLDLEDSEQPQNKLSLYADMVPLERLDEMIEVMKTARIK